MKLAVLKQRILFRMPQVINFTLVVVFLLTAGSALAQRIEKISGSRFETETLTHEVAEESFGNLSFTSSSYIGGKLKLVASDCTTPQVTYRKLFKANSLQQAEEFAEYIAVEIEELENELAVSVQSKSRPPWSGTNFSGRVDVQIELPANEELRIYVRTSSYSIEIYGPFASVDVSNEFGAIEVAQISRKVKISTDNGKVTVRDCTGPVTVRTSSRPITLKNVDSKLGTVRLRNAHGKIALDSVRGEIDARTEFASISGTALAFESGRSKLRTENADIRLEAIEINGDLTLINSHGKIDLEIPDNTSAEYTLQVDEGGRIYTKDILIKIDRVMQTLVTGSSGGRQNRIDIDMRGVGTITLTGKPQSEL